MPVKRQKDGSSLCQATSRSGAPCTAHAKVGGKFCSLHGDPKRAAEIGRRGGKSNRHVYENRDFPVPNNAAQVKDMLAEVTSGILSGRLNPKIGSVIGYLSIPLLKAIEAADFEERLRKLEAGSSEEANQSRRNGADGEVTTAAP